MAYDAKAGPDWPLLTGARITHEKRQELQSRILGRIWTVTPPKKWKALLYTLYMIVWGGQIPVIELPEHNKGFWVSCMLLCEKNIL